jgi:hypothetical protein
MPVMCWYGEEGRRGWFMLNHPWAGRVDDGGFRGGRGKFLVHDRLHLVWIKHIVVGFGNNMLVNTNWFGWCCGQAFSMIPLSMVGILKKVTNLSVRAFQLFVFWAVMQHAYGKIVSKLTELRARASAAKKI